MEDSGCVKLTWASCTVFVYCCSFFAVLKKTSERGELLNLLYNRCRVSSYCGVRFNFASEPCERVLNAPQRLFMNEHCVDLKIHWHVPLVVSKMRRSRARKVRQPVAINNRFPLVHYHHSEGDHRVHPLIWAPASCLEGDLCEILGLVLRDGQRLALLRRPGCIRALDGWPSRHGPHGIDQNEVAVIGLEGISGIELGRGLPSSQYLDAPVCYGEPERGWPTYLGGIDTLCPVRAAVLYDLALDLWPSHRAADDREDYA